MIKIRNHLTHTGDTIVEVLIVLAILGLALAISYATANHGITQVRTAEEHSEALGLIQSQAELLRQGYANNQNLIAGPAIFCLSAPTAVNPNAVQQIAGPCPQAPFYQISDSYVSPPSSSPYFDFVVTWTGLNGIGAQREELTYRISSLAAGSVLPYFDTPTICVISCGGGGGGLLPPDVTLTATSTEMPSHLLNGNSTVGNSPLGNVLVSPNDGSTIIFHWTSNTNTSGANTTCTATWGAVGQNGFYTIPVASLSTPPASTGPVTYSVTCKSQLGPNVATAASYPITIYYPQLFQRLYNKPTNSYFYAWNPAAVQAKTKSTWKVETGSDPANGNSYGDIGYIDPQQAPGEAPVYQYNNGQDYLYTLLAPCGKSLCGNPGWGNATIAGYAVPTSSPPNPPVCPSYTQTVSQLWAPHFYTIDLNEVNGLTDGARPGSSFFTNNGTAFCDYY